MRRGDESTEILLPTQFLRPMSAAFHLKRGPEVFRSPEAFPRSMSGLRKLMTNSFFAHPQSFNELQRENCCHPPDGPILHPACGAAPPGRCAWASPPSPRLACRCNPDPRGHGIFSTGGCGMVVNLFYQYRLHCGQNGVLCPPQANQKLAEVFGAGRVSPPAVKPATRAS